MKRLILYGVIAILIVAPKVAWADTYCTIVALHDVPKDDAKGTQALKKGETSETSYLNNGIFAEMGGYTYPQYIVINGKSIEAVRLTNCYVSKNGNLEYNDPTTRELDDKRNKIIDQLEEKDSIDGQSGLFRVGVENYATEYLYDPKSQCGELIGKVLSGDENSLNKLRSTPEFCKKAFEGKTPDQSPDFIQGHADGQAYTSWFGSLSGDYLAGATYWSANRSKTGHLSCNDPSAPSTGANWVAGCTADQQRLNGPDQKRMASPEYRRGWNSALRSTPTETPAPATADAPAPPPDQSGVPVNATPADTGGAPTPAANNTPTSSILGMITSVGILIITLCIYFFPSIVANTSKKRNADAIAVLNLLLGWTILGWVLALVWAHMKDPAGIAVSNPTSNPPPTNPPPASD